VKQFERAVEHRDGEIERLHGLLSSGRDLGAISLDNFMEQTQASLEIQKLKIDFLHKQLASTESYGKGSRKKMEEAVRMAEERQAFLDAAELRNEALRQQLELVTNHLAVAAEQLAVFEANVDEKDPKTKKSRARRIRIHGKEEEDVATESPTLQRRRTGAGFTTASPVAAPLSSSTMPKKVPDEGNEGIATAKQTQEEEKEEDDDEEEEEEEKVELGSGNNPDDSLGDIARQVVDVSSELLQRDEIRATYEADIVKKDSQLEELKTLLNDSERMRTQNAQLVELLQAEVAALQEEASILRDNLCLLLKKKKKKKGSNSSSSSSRNTTSGGVDGDDDDALSSTSSSSASSQSKDNTGKDVSFE